MLRLTGGEFRGRFIQTPASKVRGQDLTRPSQARLRQALFNSIQAEIPDAKVLDLFAGTGALGFEALSRGAAHVVFVEEARSVLKLLDRNVAELGVENRTEIIGDSVARAPKRLAGFAPFDLILADPPYAADWEMKLLNEFKWDELLAPGGYFILEWGTQKSQVSELPERAPFLVKVREKNYGDSVLTTYQRELLPEPSEAT
jgi:16S rRNA (guanine966-N2)-methyltransferase